jgi:hypothetical protein
VCAHCGTERTPDSTNCLACGSFLTVVIEYAGSPTMPRVEAWTATGDERYRLVADEGVLRV